MESKKNNQLSQKYDDFEINLINIEAKKQRIKVATLIRKCVLDSIEANKNEKIN